MSSFKSDVDGELVIENNDLVFVDSAEEATQILRQELRFFLSEWFLDLTQGIPFYEDILVKNPNLQRVDAILKAKILNSPGVLELLAFNLEYDASRSLSLSFQARSTSGIINFEEVIP